MAPPISYTLPAPYLGLNARDAEDQMPEGYAIRLTNMIPKGSGVELRGGYQPWAVSITSQVYSLFEFASQSGTAALVAAAGNDFWNCTAEGNAVALSAASITNNEWQGHNFANRLIVVNGVDQPRQLQLTGASLTIADATFTGIADDNTLLQGCSYRSRQYFVQKNTQSVWYGDTSSVTGALTEFPVGRLLTRGGKLLWVNTLSNNMGNAMQDNLVICSENGEILAYTGSYPADSTWSLQQRKVIGKPLGVRSSFHVNGDLWVITEAGIASIRALLGDADSFYVSDVIYEEWLKQVKLYKGNTHWAGVDITHDGLALVSVPEGQFTPGVAAQAGQFVINTKTGAWCKFSALPGLSWAVFNSELYFGGDDGAVYKALTGTDDNGSRIPVDVKYAFNALNDRANVKHFLDARPYIKTTAATTLGIDIDTDFRDKNITNDVTIDPERTAAVWDVAEWDVDTWEADPELLMTNVGLTGIGTFGALRLYGQVKGAELKLSACQIRYNRGGQL